MRRFEPAVPPAQRRYDWHPSVATYADGLDDGDDAEDSDYAADPRTMSYGQWRRTWQKAHPGARIAAAAVLIVVAIILGVVASKSRPGNTGGFSGDFGGTGTGDTGFPLVSPPQGETPLPPGTKLTIFGSLVPSTGTQPRGIVKVYQRGRLLRIVHTDNHGNFRFALAVGRYEFDAFIGRSACYTAGETFRVRSDAAMPIELVC